MAFASWQTWATSQVVTAGDLNQDIRDNGEALFPDEDAGVSWSPVLLGSTTDPTTSSAVGTQYRIGAMQFCFARFVISTAGSGTYTVALPRASVGLTKSGSIGSGSIVGSWQARDDSLVLTEGGGCLVNASDEVIFHLTDNTSSTIVTDAVPWSWAVGDVLSFTATYPIA